MDNNRKIRILFFTESRSIQLSRFEHSQINYPIRTRYLIPLYRNDVGLDGVRPDGVKPDAVKPDAVRPDAVRLMDD